MTTYTPIAESNHFIVLDKYTKAVAGKCGHRAHKAGAASSFPRSSVGMHTESE